MTYYKYAEREANSQINWAEVSKGLSDTIGQIDKDRQAKKAAIDEATRQDMLTLADAPKGENTTASAWTINYANDMMNYRLTIDRLLKSGKMSLKDYQVASQNSKDSTNLVFTMSKEYQDQYKVIMDRKRAGDSSRFETEIAALNESFANISNTVPTINSTNGMVYLSNPEVGEDGVQKLGKNYVSLQALRNRVNAKIDRYDLSDGLAAAASQLGDYTISQVGRTNFRRTGLVTDISDPTLRSTYEQWENATVQDIMASGYQLASVMADNMNINPKTGNQYRITMDKDEFDTDKTGDVILMANENGSGILMPQFKEDQKTDVKAFIKGQIKNYIDQKSEKRPFQEPGTEYAPQYVYEAGKENQQKENALLLWNRLYTSPTSTGKASAKAGILGTDMAIQQGLIDIDFTDPSNVKLIYDNPIKNRSIPLLKNGRPVKGDEWARSGSEFTGISDDRVLSKYSKNSFGGSEAQLKDIGGGRQGRNENYDNFRSSLADQPVKDLIDADNAEETAAALNAAYSQYDLSFDYNESFGTDEIIIKYKGKTVGNAIPVDSKEAGASSIKGAIEGILKNPPADDAAAKAAAAKKGNSPITAPGGGTFGSATKPRG
jgi:hypothetical protein